MYIMRNIEAFPKIFTIGQRFIETIFDSSVEITEKVDGSQFAFGKVDGELVMRSKGQMVQWVQDSAGMFAKAISYVKSIADKLPDNIIFYCEYLNSPKHNKLCYGRVPLNNLVLFGIMMKVDGEEGMQIVSEHSSLREFADNLKIDCIPLVYSGEIKSIDEIKELLNRESYLGKAKIEGVVVKNYNQHMYVGGVEFPVMTGKYVSEEFKEVMNMSKGHNSNPWIDFKNSYKTEARFDKAYQHLRDNGLITSSPKDIGAIIKDVMTDVEAEEKENITNFLWSYFGKDLLKSVADGVPVWYKNKLLESTNK